MLAESDAEAASGKTDTGAERNEVQKRLLERFLDLQRKGVVIARKWVDLLWKVGDRSRNAMIEILDDMDDLVTKSESLADFALRRSLSDDENGKLLIDYNRDSTGVIDKCIPRSFLATAAASTESSMNESSTGTSFACKPQHRRFRGMDVFECPVDPMSEMSPVDNGDVGDESAESLDFQTQVPTQLLRRSASWPKLASSSVYTFRYQRFSSW